MAVSPFLWNPNWAAPPAALLVCTWSPSLGSGCTGSSLGRLGEVEEEQEPHCSCGRAGCRFLTAAPRSCAALQPGWSRHLEHVCMVLFGKTVNFYFLPSEGLSFGVASRDEHVLHLKSVGFWVEDSGGPTVEHSSPSRRKKGTYLCVLLKQFS